MLLTNLVPSIPDNRDLLYIPLTGTVADETDLVVQHLVQHRVLDTYASSSSVAFA
mgnify:CR=1 FL=1